MNRETIVIPQEWQDYNVFLFSIGKNFTTIKSTLVCNEQNIRCEDILCRNIDNKFFKLLYAKNVIDCEILVLSFEEVFPKQITTTIYE